MSKMQTKVNGHGNTNSAGRVEDQEVRMPEPTSLHYRGTTDFSTWGRETLERFAREAAEENRELRENQRHLLDYIRKLTVERELWK